MDNDVLYKQELLSPHSSRATIAHMLASKCSRPNAFGAQVPVYSQLNIPVWKAYLASYMDRDVAEFLQFGWP